MSSPTQVKFLAREQIFRIDMSGLMPLTPHYFYVERQLIPSTKVKPVGGSLGDALITDKDGKISFDYYYSADLTVSVTTVLELQQMVNALIAGVKEVVVANKNSETLPADFKDTFFSYAVSSIVLEVVF